MSEEDIEKLIREAIRRHELRVAFISAPLGLAVLGGLMHAIWLLR